MKESGNIFEFFRGKLKLIQPKKHKVSVDLVVFLSKIRGIKRDSRVIDLGAGFGFLSIALALKFGCKVWAVERDKLMLSLLEENIKLNDVSDVVEVVPADVRFLREKFTRGSFDVVVSNPPFYPESYGVNDGGFHFEKDTTLKDFLNTASHLLRDGGYANFLSPAFRLRELVCGMEKVNLRVRFLSLIYPTLIKGAKLCCASALRNVPGPMTLDAPVVLNDPAGGYTEGIESLLESFL